MKVLRGHYPPMMNALKQIIPASAKPALKLVFRHIRRPFRTLQRSVSRPVTRDAIIQGIRALGPGAEDVVMVHSSLSRIGFVEGGAETVIEALLEVVQPGGTIVMPAYPMDRPALEYLAANPVFDPRNTPSRVGKITEVFRLQPDAIRSIHATHSVAAIGDRAGQIVAGHFSSLTPFGAGTPFRRLLELDAWVVGLGVDIGPMTFYHVFEDLVDEFPIPVYHPTLQRTRLLIGRTEQEAWTKVHDPKLAQFRIDHDTQIKTLVARQLTQWDLLQHGQVGDGPAYAIRANDLMIGLGRMLKEGITIYNCQRMHRNGWPLPAGIAKSF